MHFIILYIYADLFRPYFDEAIIEFKKFKERLSFYEWDMLAIITSKRGIGCELMHILYLYKYAFSTMRTYQRRFISEYHVNIISHSEQAVKD
jgi:hypothetical protein